MLPPEVHIMRIGIGAIVKNEGPYLLEWIAFHQAIGVTDFIIADNGSDDGTTELLQALEVGGWVDTFPFPGRAKQMDAYREILTRSKGIDWMAFIDADEFILPSGHDLAGYLATRPALAGSVAINWACYGSSFHQRQADGLVTERFKWRGKKEWGTNRHYKSIVRPDAVSDFTNPHHTTLKEGWAAVNSDNRQLTFESEGIAAETAWAGIRLNHYVVKSREEFDQKQARGRATIDAKRPDNFFEGHDRNEVNDPMPESLVDLTKENMSRMAFMLGDFGGWTPHVLDRVSVAS